MDMKIRRSSAGILCAALLATAAIYAHADDRPNDMDRKDHMEARFKKMAKDLGLTADQEKQLEQHRKAHREEAKQLFEQMKQKREALEAEMEKPDMSMDKIKALHNDLKEVQNKMADQRLDGILEVRKILTPEQFKKFHEMTKDHWKHGGHHMRDKDPEGEDAPPPMK